MSYILDALKKAERERQLGETPNRKSLLYETPIRRRLWLRFFVLAILLLNSAIVVYGLIAWHQAMPDPIPVSAEQLPRLPDAAEPQSASSKPEPLFEPSTEALTPEPAKVVIAEQPLSIGAPQPYRRLAQNLREQLAPLNLDLHVYGDSPERRFVLINSQRYQTGDWLQEGLLLETITAEGVILSFQGQRFSLSAQP